MTGRSLAGGLLLLGTLSCGEEPAGPTLGDL